MSVQRLALLVVIILSSLYADQRPTGEIRLKVNDPSGAPMQLRGRLQNLSTGATRNFETDARGASALTPLPFGKYNLTLSKKGFETQTFLLEVNSPEPLIRTVTMALGSLASSVDVVAPTPLTGGNLSREETAVPVQTLNPAEIESSGALDLSDLLNRRLSGVNINDNQSNPYQPDVNYRGYTASPLLGTPQGLSIYMDGVRLNQPFGDVVSWDLIPRNAIAEVALIPGSNPLFGLNTLGGAISIETKDGRTHPGTSIQFTGGSFGRRAVEAEHGGSYTKGWNWFLAGNLFHEDGWRIQSPSDVKQLFTRLGWQGAHTSIGLSFTYADNKLIGNGLQEERLLAQNYRSGYTYGDITANRSPFVNLTVRHAFNATLTLSANAYFRYLRADTVNTNLNTNSLDQPVYQPSQDDIAALEGAGYSGFPLGGANPSNTPFPKWTCIAEALLAADTADLCDAANIASSTRQNNYGLAGQITWNTNPHGHRNQLTVGGAWDRSSLTYQQTSQAGYINPDHTVTTVNAFDPTAAVNLHGTPQTSSVYFTDTLSLGHLTLTAAARFNRTAIDNADRLNPGGGPGSLDGRYVFERFNPSIGATYSPNRFVNIYASYSESNRAPTSIELGCADPTNPCNLPNALASDPPLRQVVARTVEAGIRNGVESGHLNWSAGWFRAANHDDLLFVAYQQTGNGYFKNFGETLRQGVEVQLSRRVFDRVTLGGNYTLLRATYASPEFVDGSSNSTNASGVIQIAPGDRIPLIPSHLVKAYVDTQITSRLSADLDFIAVSSSYARGNENNRNQPDGVYYMGSGISPGYGVLNLAAKYQIHRRVQLFAQINNALNHRYYTSAQLAATGFTAQGTFLAQPFPPVDGNYPIIHSTFYSPGASIGAWGGIRVNF